MRALWIDAGNDCDWQRAAVHEMTALFYPVNDPVADVKRRIAETRAHGYAPGLYMAWNWPQFVGLGGASAADKMHSLVAAVEGTGAVKVQFDIELHDPQLISDCLTRFRALRPKQDMSWTMEGGQGGWMTPEFVQRIVALKVRVVPQLYSGSMGQNWCPLQRTRDLTKRGFPDALVSPFYDAAAIGNYIGWDGFAFTMGRLP